MGGETIKIFRSFRLISKFYEKSSSRSSLLVGPPPVLVSPHGGHDDPASKMVDYWIFSLQNVHISMWRHSHFPQVLENDCQIRGKVKEIFPMLLAPGQGGPYLKM